MPAISQVLIFSLLLVTFESIGKSQVKSECDLPPLRVPGFRVEAHSHTDLSLAKSDVKPSVSPKLAIPLSLDELQRGHLDSPTGRGNSYFWLVNVDAGSYKVGLDLWPDSIGGEVGGDLEWSALNGKKLDSLGRMNKAPGPLRGVFKFTTQNPRKLLLRYTNNVGPSTYYLGLFHEDTPIESPFFGHGHPLPSVWYVGQTGIALLDGRRPVVRDVHYLMQLCAGSYTLSVEFRREDARNANVGGQVDALDVDGDLLFHILKIRGVGSAITKEARFTIATDRTVMLRFRGAFAQESLTFTVNRLSAPANEHLVTNEAPGAL